MNKTMILAILVAYKAFNNKSLTIVVNEDNHEYVVNDVVIDSIFTLNKSSLKVLSVTVLVKNIEVLDKFCKDLYNIGSVVKIERQMF